MKRICINCGKEVSFFQSLFNNKCCSYKCDLENEEKVDIYERKKWEDYMESKIKDKELPINKKHKSKNNPNKEGKEIDDKQVKGEKLNNIVENVVENESEDLNF